MIELLCNRRSIRKFKDKKIEQDKVQKLIQAALLSPSSRSICPWEFIIIDDKNTLVALSKAKAHGSKFLDNTPMAIVIVADESICDVWIEDASIASIIIQLQAEKLDLGSCWVQIRNRQDAKGASSEHIVKELLDIPVNYRVESIIGIGYKDEEKESYNIDELQYNKVHLNKFK
ncbi:nitroreductase [Natranaerovirga pectinivora]|uniref:Nitroreductase n=1 Tax=Natranaerovirga pectinivora TaxID=682400 RepID=A0A4R3MKN8_9FIRM|nr:nitroreductase family protein [Natranaerovirga pectinivora]TCT14381.1 nitroreductase [Natranaerovirga pectinivora]